jgi:hypothetical protein
MSLERAIAIGLINFHKTAFNTDPFYTIDYGKYVLHQSLPSALYHFQPELGERKPVQTMMFG